MQLSDVFLQLGEERLRQLVRGISIGKLKTYQLYERFKIRTHLAKVNTENLRKAAPRFWQRLDAQDEEFATDLSQAILISHMDMIAAVLNFLGVPNEEGFFEKDLDAKQYLTEGWQARAYRAFQGRISRIAAALLYQSSRLGTGRRKQQAYLPAADRSDAGSSSTAPWRELTRRKTPKNSKPCAWKCSGRKGVLAQLSKDMGKLTPEERAARGKFINTAKQALESRYTRDASRISSVPRWRSGSTPNGWISRFPHPACARAACIRSRRSSGKSKICSARWDSPCWMARKSRPNFTISTR